MKEMKLIQMRNTVSNLQKAVENMYMELTYQRQLNEALANVCKSLPGWEEAVESEKKRMEDAKNAQVEEVPVASDAADDITPQEQEEVSAKAEAPKLDLEL